LKKYSTIPNQFINDFYNIIKDYEDLDNLFYISLDNISKWLNQTKGNIKRTLIKNFSKNIDYTLEKIVKNRGSPREVIL
jgi:hypothetical protein